MADILSQLYNACDPNKPATAEQYVDLSAVRGDNAFSKTISLLLRRASGIDNSGSAYVRALFSGHTGSGKSSELRHLQESLWQKAQAGSRFLPVLMDGVEYLDDYDADIEDVLVALIAELAEEIRQHTDIDPRQTLLEKRWDEIKDLLVADVEVPEGEFGAAGFKAKFRLRRQSSEDRKKIRAGLRPKLPTFLAEINATFGDIRRRLRTANPKDGGAAYTDFILIADSLERIKRVGTEASEDSSHRRLFLESGAELVKLEAHAIWTVPLSLVRSAAGELASVFGVAPYVLPMVKTEHRGPDHMVFDTGMSRLIQLVEQRIHPHTLGSAIAPAALDWMLQQCGGDVRALMKYIQAATAYIENPPVSHKAAVTAVNQTASTFAPAISAGNWQKLAMLELSPDQQVDNRDPEIRDMLRQTWILEYVNGSGDGDVTPWYAVHPVIRRLSQFKHALEAANLTDITGGGTTEQQAS